MSELGSWGQGGELGVVGVFITWGCCNKMPQIYYRNVFSRSSTDQKSPWRHQLLALPGRFQLLVAPGVPFWLAAASSNLFCLPWPSFLCLSVCPISVSNKDTLIGIPGPTLI